MDPARQLSKCGDRRARVIERVVDLCSHLVGDLLGLAGELE
jgi:hypothetical protein